MRLPAKNIRIPSAPALRWVAIVGALMIWMLGLLAAGPQLHTALHSDAEHVDHTCAVTLLSHGIDETADLGRLVAAPALFPAGERAVQITAKVADPAHRLPLGCGPPRC